MKIHHKVPTNDKLDTGPAVRYKMSMDTEAKQNFELLATLIKIAWQARQQKNRIQASHLLAKNVR